MSREKEPEPFLPGSERVNRLLEEIRREQSKPLNTIFKDLQKVKERKDLIPFNKNREIGRGKMWHPHGRIPQEQKSVKK